MANAEQLAILRQGGEVWNAWRRDHAAVRPDLRDAVLTGADLTGADLRDANLIDAVLTGANLTGASLSRASLRDADLNGADLRRALLRDVDLSDADLRDALLSGADLRVADFNSADLRRALLHDADLRRAFLTGASLTGASLIGANLTGADLTGADLRDADLTGASLSGAFLQLSRLVGTNLERATLVGCRIYGIATWELRTAGAIQRDLVITLDGDPAITVDDIEVAQFIYLLLNNQNLRRVISTVANRAVLILGRFTDERKVVLDRIKEALRGEGFVPLLFDFEPSPDRDVTETIQLLANLSRFVIADITAAKSIPQELSAIVPHLPSVPVQPIILAGEREYGMFEHWRQYQSVLPEFRYNDADHLIANLHGAVIQPAMTKRAALRDIAALEARNQDLEREMRDRERIIEEQQQIITALQKGDA